MTPALLVPDTPEGRLIRQLPSLAAGIAAQVANQVAASGIPLSSAGTPSFDLWAGTPERLAQVITPFFDQFTLAEVQRLGVAGTLEAIKRMKLFTWDDTAQKEKIAVHVAAVGELRTFPLPVIQRKPGLYAIHPAFALLYLGQAPNGAGEVTTMDADASACYAVYDLDFGVLFSQGLIDAMKGSIAQMVDQLEEGALVTELYNAFWTAPQFLEAVTIEREEVTEQGTYTVQEVAYQVKPSYNLGTVYPWPTNAWNHPIVIIQPFAELGWKLRDARSKAKRAQRLQWVAIALAAWGGYAAISSIASSGFTLTNVAQLTASIDRLPGVDLGTLGDIAQGFSSGTKLAAGIPGGSTMFDFEVGDVFDPSAFEVDLTLEDIGASVIDFDDSIFADFGLEATDLISDDFGNIFTVTGEAVTLDPEAYVKSIYIDESGNYRDFTNRVLQTQAENEQIFNETGADEPVFMALAQKAQAFAGNSFVPEPGDNARPAETPAPAAQGQVPWFEALSKEAMGWFKTITSYSLAKEQLDKTGRFTPPYQTSPTGTAYSQVPGVPIRRADGSTVVNNGNGTQTVQYADGRVETMRASVNPGQFAGGQIIPGVSNQTLLIAGGALLAVALLARRN